MHLGQGEQEGAGHSTAGRAGSRAAVHGRAAGARALRAQGCRPCPPLAVPTCSLPVTRLYEPLERISGFAFG